MAASDDNAKSGKVAKQEDPRVAAARQRAANLAKAGPGQTPGQFFKDTLSELKKTTWPDRQTLTKSTMIVLAFIFATAIWVGAFDFVLSHVTSGLFK